MNGGTLNFSALYISSIFGKFELFGGPVVEEERLRGALGNGVKVGFSGREPLL